MFLSQRPKGDVVFVADIDDVSVGIAIARMQKHLPATILASERRRLPIEPRTSEQAGIALIKLLEETATTVLSDYTKSEGSRPPKNTYAILRASWSTFRTAEASTTFDTPRAITKDTIAAVTKQALAAGGGGTAGNALEAGVMQVFLSGYPTGNPLGKRAPHIAVTAFESDADSTVRKGIETVLGKVLPGRTVAIKSGMRATLAALHEHLPDIHRYVILTIGGEASDCAIVRKESVTQTAHATEGTTSIIKRIAGAGLPEEIFTQMRMLATDTCATDACRALKDSLARIEPDLAKTFGEMFSTLATQRRIPNRAILTCPPEFAPWLSAFFARIDFAQFTATMQPLTVEILGDEHLRNALTRNPSAYSDTSLAVALAYVHILEESV